MKETSKKNPQNTMPEKRYPYVKTRHTRRSLGSPVTRGSCPHSTQNHHKSTWNNIPLLFNCHPKS